MMIRQWLKGLATGVVGSYGLGVYNYMVLNKKINTLKEATSGDVYKSQREQKELSKKIDSLAEKQLCMKVQQLDLMADLSNFFTSTTLSIYTAAPSPDFVFDDKLIHIDDVRKISGTKVYMGSKTDVSKFDGECLDLGRVEGNFSRYARKWSNPCFNTLFNNTTFYTHRFVKKKQ